MSKVTKRFKFGFKHVEFIPNKLEANVLYISDKYGTATHLCMCGCNTEVVTPLSKDMWFYEINKRNQLTLKPSVGNYKIPCKSHYLLQKGDVLFI